MIRMARGSLILLMVCALLSGWALGVLMAMPKLGTIQLTACQTEDSTNCYWDAGTRGNGTGVPFVTIDDVTYYPALDGLQLPTK